MQMLPLEAQEDVAITNLQSILRSISGTAGKELLYLQETIGSD